jgi:hypothetical protein
LTRRRLSVDCVAQSDVPLNCASVEPLLPHQNVFKPNLPDRLGDLAVHARPMCPTLLRQQ